MEDRDSLDDVLSVTTTVATLADAQALARALVEGRLAACVQLEPGVQSFYRWDGKTCDDAEVRLTIKTVPAAAPALQAFLAQRHPYDLPQFLATPLRASAAYAQWVREAVSLPDRIELGRLKSSKWPRT